MTPGATMRPSTQVGADPASLQTHMGGQWLLWFLSKRSPVEDESCREHSP